MNITYIYYLSSLLFLIGVIGALFFETFSRILISLQFIMLASIINFLSFSQTLYENPVWAVLFVLFSTLLLFLFESAIVFYFYLNVSEAKFGKFDLNKNLYYFNIKDWLE
jgi:NADH:ubiquinone oxidoreductase subunit K